jgi:hypothetical protein
VVERLLGVDGQVQGVASNHVNLDREAKRFAFLTSHFGKRIRYWVLSTEGEMSLPPPEILEVYRHYSASMLGMMRERREWFKLQQSVAGKTDQPLLSEAEYAALEAAETERLLDAVPVDELERRLAEKKRTP